MSVTSETVPIDVTLRGDVVPVAGDWARARVAAVLATARKPVRGAHITLDWHHEGSVRHHASAEVSVDLDGTVVRASSVRPSMRETVNELVENLHDRVEGRRERGRGRQRR